MRIKRTISHATISDFAEKLQRGDIKRNDTYDCYYDVKTGEWLERKCGDDDCEFCAARPERAF